MGQYLVQRHKTELGIWMTKLSSDDDVIVDRNLFKDKITSKSFSLQSMMHDTSDLKHVIFCKVPSSSYFNFKSGQNLLQIVIKNNTVIYEIEGEGKLKELDTLQGIDVLSNPDKFV